MLKTFISFELYFIRTFFMFIWFKKNYFLFIWAIFLFI